MTRTVRIPHGVRTDQLGCYPFLLEQQLRAQASLANLLFCVGVRVGSLRYIPVEAHMYSWFIDLYVPCTVYNPYKTLPIFMHECLDA